MVDGDRAGNEYLGLCEAGRDIASGDAKEILKEFPEGEQPWALPWPCIYEFIRVVTHPRVFDPPTDLESALDDLDSLLQSPSLTLLREGPRHSVFTQRLLRSGQAAGNLAHDAHIAASLSMGLANCGPPIATLHAFPEFACEIRLTRKTDIRFLSGAGAIKTCQDSTWHESSFKALQTFVWPTGGAIPSPQRTSVAGPQEKVRISRAKAQDRQVRTSKKKFVFAFLASWRDQFSNSALSGHEKKFKNHQNCKLSLNEIKYL
jgi:predicted nucleic acid-binding protein